MIRTLVGTRDVTFSTPIQRVKWLEHGTDHPVPSVQRLSMGRAIPLFYFYASKGMLQDDLYLY
jgi:hypothetical protein